MNSGISYGSCCRSPSMAMMTSPRAWSKPACSAVVWPKLRRRSTNDTRSSASAIRSSTFGRAVPAAVVDEDHLVRLAHVPHHAHDPLVELLDDRLLVVERDHDAVLDRRPRRIHRAIAVHSAPVESHVFWNASRTAGSHSAASSRSRLSRSRDAPASSPSASPGCVMISVTPARQRPPPGSAIPRRSSRSGRRPRSRLWRSGPAPAAH